MALEVSEIFRKKSGRRMSFLEQQRRSKESDLERPAIDPSIVGEMMEDWACMPPPGRSASSELLRRFVGGHGLVVERRLLRSVDLSGEPQNALRALMLVVRGQG